MTTYLSEDEDGKAQLYRHRKVWREKAVLRRIYNEEFFSRLLSHRAPGGVSVEIGGGPGFLRERFPEVISTDLIRVPWLQASVDAQRLPFRAESVTNVLGLDVLHHLADPIQFLRETERVLRPGGRLILVEPWITPFSRFIYRYFHQEDCDLSVRPWDAASQEARNAKKAFEGNQAIPYLLFGQRNVQRIMANVPKLQVKYVERFCLFAYLLSFGFKRPNFLPEPLYPFVSWIERVTQPIWEPVAALRALLVAERIA